MGQALGCSGCCGGVFHVARARREASQAQTCTECQAGQAHHTGEVTETVPTRALSDTTGRGTEDSMVCSPATACGRINESVLSKDEDSAALECGASCSVQVDAEMALVESSTGLSESNPSQQSSCTATEVSEDSASLACGSEDPATKSALDVECSEQPQCSELSVTVPQVAAHVLPLALEAHAPSNAGEAYLAHILSAMDCHLQPLRWTQQWLVAEVDLACRWALGINFGRLELVGSVALFVETPGSDMDVVCFTQQHGQEALGLAADILRRISSSLFGLISRYPNGAGNLSLNLINDARVPILRVLWGPPGTCIAVDISIDQRRPLDHVRWFQRIGASPNPGGPLPPVPPVVTSALRCVKWWLRQRQIPPTKEGGLPTLAWLLMALYTCQGLRQHDGQSAGLLAKTLSAALSSFFSTFASHGGLDGVLAFCAEASLFQFKRRTNLGQSPWAELSVLDPTQGGADGSDLVPKLLPATQLLLVYELRRAHRYFSQLEHGDGAASVGAAFEAVPEGSTSLPSFITTQTQFHALLHLGDPAKGVGIVEAGIIERIAPFPEWKAPFLHRSDTRSEVYVRLLDVDCEGKSCRPRPKSTMVLCPCHFICRFATGATVDGKNRWALSAQDVDRFRSMQTYLQELREQPQLQEDQQGSAATEKSSEKPR